MRKKVAALVVTAGFLTMAFAVPAATARERKNATPPKSTATVETCTEVRKNLQTLAKAGKKTAYCTGSPKAATSIGDKPAPGGVGVQASPFPSEICEQSLGLPPNTWPQNRFETCASWGNDLFAVDVTTGQIVGYMEIRHQTYYVTNVGSRAFSLKFFAKVTQLVGRGFEQAHITGYYSCHAAVDICTVAGRDAGMQRFSTLGTTWTVERDIYSEVDIPGELQHLGAWLDWSIFDIFDPANRADYQAVPPHPVQCDFQAEDAENDPADWPGCVFDDYVPIFDVWRSRYPQFHDHIRDAFSSGLPRELVRMINPARRDENGNVACPGWWVRPEGFQCDEYPFRSTHQGAASMLEIDPNIIGTTRSWCQNPYLAQDVSGAGWSSCMIPWEQNWLGGVDLGQFYARNRMIDGDRFGVQLING